MADSITQILGCLCNIAAFEGNWGAALVVAGAVTGSIAAHPQEVRVVSAALWTLSNLANLAGNLKHLRPVEPAVVALLELHPGVEAVAASGCTLLSRTLRQGTTALAPGAVDVAALAAVAAVDVAPAAAAAVAAVAAVSGGAPVPSPVPVDRLLTVLEAHFTAFGDCMELLRSAIIAVHVVLEQLEPEAGDRGAYLRRVRRVLPALVASMQVLGGEAGFMDAAMRLLCFLFDDAEGWDFDAEMTGRMADAARALGPVLAGALCSFAGGWWARV